VDTTQKLPTVLSLCTGYGGIERGLDLAGVEHRVIAHVEIEAFAIANLVAKMEAGKLDAAPVWSNLKTLPVESFRDRVDILTGGYPCQPFSAAGKRLGEEDPRHLWPYICDIIRAVRPVRCFFENVEGHISLGLREVISDLESLGYKVAWGIFSAREVGAPHQRKRVYIMANCDNGLSQFSHKEIRTGGDASINGSELMGNSKHHGSSSTQIGGSNAENARGPEKGSEDAVQSSGASGRSNNESLSRSDTMADSQSELSKRTISERDRIGQSEEALGDRSDSEGASSVADTDSTRSREGGISCKGADGSKLVSNGQAGGTILADPINERSQRQPGDGKNVNKRGWFNPKQDGSISEEGVLSRGHTAGWWPPEPRLGRVVDGCANRVDRIRLLGNGVVPQTAAKAWMVLSEELESKNGRMQHE
tara:strand:- start:4557 stop:5822 length:1266 start_codon:yes stop_codon:yes gene_type:complete